MKWMKQIQCNRKLVFIFFFTLCSMQSIAQRDKTNTLLWEISGNGLQQLYVVKESGQFSCRGFRCLNV